ncbi:hypothetical protein [Tranquillimonas alkanivorans]|uniref:Hook-length control protein FliK n=1 Tax=Tranquillimonas alkanivorans TaxID=441119 RepID=A0A1I5S474_9RHOB|nr:hypothetical protein [Tranquillimonas alkanivorans]SFP65542.1 hypothetical protein SAMN04488047_11034 [Tranquillimonas alkanivorans]
MSADAAARLISALAANHPARSGWITGTVVQSFADGTMRLNTPSGSLLLRIPGGSADVGARVRLRVDGNRADLRPQAEPAPLPTARSSMPPEPPRVALPPALAELPPVVPGGTTQLQATQTLSVVFPSTASPAFAAIAALFPVVLRDGTLRGLVPPGGTRSAAVDGRLTRAARAALDTATARPVEDPAFLRWTMPFFDGGTLNYAQWTQDRDDRRTHLLLEVSFAFSGLLRLNAVREGDRLSLHLLSEALLPDALLRSVEDLARRVAEAGGMTFEFAHAVGRAADAQ